MLSKVNHATLVQERSPAALLGRISAANRSTSVAGAPFGALLGGAAATAWGLNTPALLAAGFFGCAAVALIPGLGSHSGEESISLELQPARRGVD
jgi:predicted MFS family arabinose efflux permease